MLLHLLLKNGTFSSSSSLSCSSCSCPLLQTTVPAPLRTTARGRNLLLPGHHDHSVTRGSTSPSTHNFLLSGSLMTRVVSSLASMTDSTSAHLVEEDITASDTLSNVPVKKGATKNPPTFASRTTTKQQLAKR